MNPVVHAPGSTGRDSSGMRPTYRRETKKTELLEFLLFGPGVGFMCRY